MRRLAFAAAALAVFSLATAQDKVLRVVPHSNLNILDPIWTTQYMARNHGYMVYDTLFGTDEKNRIQPQMVASWTESPDHGLWSFTLRPGLTFHDGKPVTGEDVVASLERWGKRDAMGQKLMTFVERMDSPQANTFRIFLREACGFVLEALGKPSSNVPFILPKRIADTPADKQIEDATGSGPYIFAKDEFKPGDKAVYLRKTKHVPLQPPASAVQQPEDPRGGARGDAAGAVPARAGWGEGVLPLVPVDVHVQHALREREGQRHPVEVEHEEGAGAPEELGLRRHA